MVPLRRAHEGVGLCVFVTAAPLAEYRGQMWLPTHVMPWRAERRWGEGGACCASCTTGCCYILASSNMVIVVVVVVGALVVVVVVVLVVDQ